MGLFTSRSKVWKNKDGYTCYFNYYRKPCFIYYSTKTKKFYTRDDETKMYTELNDPEVTTKNLRNLHYKRVPMRNKYGGLMKPGEEYP